MKLVIKNLTKTYKNGVKAIDNLSIEIGVGMFGLLGPNGAGKSSLMRTIATLQSPDSGSIMFGDIEVLKDNMSLRKVLGYLPQSFGVYPKMSAEDLLNYFATLKGISNANERKEIVKEVLEITNLYDVRRKYVAGYSGGMKQRFGIAQLLLNNPKLSKLGGTDGLYVRLPGSNQSYPELIKKSSTTPTLLNGDVGPVTFRNCAAKRSSTTRKIGGIMYWPIECHKLE